MAEEDRRALSLACCVFIIAVITKIIPSFFERMTADSCVYMDIGRNFFSARGFTVSYNLYQFWADRLYYPALPLYPPLFPLVIGLVWKVFGSMQAAIIFNVFIAGINSVLIFYILNTIHKNRYLSFWAALFCSISLPMQQTSMLAWAEQLSLLCILMALSIFIKDFKLSRPSLRNAGIILGIGVLARVDVAFVLLAFVLFILVHYGLNRQVLSACLYLLGGFLTVLLPYQLFCIFKYGLFYPAYAKVNSVGYVPALIRGGYYDITNLPVLRSNSLSLYAELSAFIPRFSYICLLFAAELIKDFNFLICFLIFRLAIIFKNNYSKEKFLFTIGIVSLLIHAFFISYLARAYYIDIYRYSLLHFVCFIPLGLMGFYTFFKERYFKKYYRAFYYLGLIVLVFSIGRFFINMHIKYFSPYRDTLKEEDNLREDLFSWIRSRTGNDELIAVTNGLLQEAFSLARPIVSMPAKNFLTSRNFREFLSIYRPSLMVIDADMLEMYPGIIPAFAYELGGAQEWRRLYRVYGVK